MWSTYRRTPKVKAYTLGFIVALFTTSTVIAATGNDYDDWGLCASQGLKIKRDAKGGPSCGSEPGLAARCPAGSVATPFEMPVYDEEGLFVVCYETVSVCIPEDLEPAG